MAEDPPKFSPTARYVSCWPVRGPTVGTLQKKMLFGQIEQVLEKSQGILRGGERDEPVVPIALR
jgi:hypothetical protein